MSKKMVFAHLLTWFQTKEYSNNWEMWSSDYEGSIHNPDKILENNKLDIAASTYPLTGVYDSNDPSIIEFQLLTMKLAGIDGVIIDWDGREINHYRHVGLMNILPYIKKFGMKIIICFEEWCGYWPISTKHSRKQQINKAIKELIWLHDEILTLENYQKVDSKIPLLVFRKIHDHWFTSDEWEYIKKKTQHLNISYMFNDIYDESFRNVSDGYFTWVSGFDYKTNINDLEYYKNELSHFMEKKEEFAKDKMFFGSVMPGFDDSPVNGWGGGNRIAPRYDLKRYKLSWENMKKYDIDLVQIVTWNDWNEGSQIEPCDVYGYKYIEETINQINVFKNRVNRITLSDMQLPLQLLKYRRTNKYNSLLEKLSNSLSEFDIFNARRINQILKGIHNEKENI